MSVGSEQRRHPRLQCQGVAQVHLAVDAEPCSARIVNLSVEGCLAILQQPHDLEKDDLLELTFSVNQLPFRVKGQVKSIRSETTVGFQFPALSARVRRQLEDLVEELEENHLKNCAAYKKREPVSMSRLR